MICISVRPVCDLAHKPVCAVTRPTEPDDLSRLDTRLPDLFRLAISLTPSPSPLHSQSVKDQSVSYCQLAWVRNDLISVINDRIKSDTPGPPRHYLTLDSHQRRRAGFQVLRACILCGKVLRARLVDTERLFIQIVAGGGESARAAAHANVAKLAATALPIEIIYVAQLMEHK